MKVRGSTRVETHLTRLIPIKARAKMLVLPEFIEPLKGGDKIALGVESYMRSRRGLMCLYM